MNIEACYLEYQRVREESSAWRLLRADNGPLILAFVSTLFKEVSEVSLEAARTALELALSPLSLSERTSRQYINSWIDDGWLREQDQKLMMTSACQTAVQFVNGLKGTRELTSTASHLETVQTELRSLLVTLSPDLAERQSLLEEQMISLQRQIDQLLQGVIPQLSSAAKRERVRHFYNLALGLTRDFGYLEDEMGRHELEVQHRILSDTGTSGSVLESVLDAEDVINKSPAGQAFDGFYELLANEDRAAAFRSQLSRLVDLGVSEHLDRDELRFVRRMIPVLADQSSRVLIRRKAATERIRAFLQSGSKDEMRQVDQLLKDAMRLATRLNQVDGVHWLSETSVLLITGKLQFVSPYAIKVTKAGDDAPIVLDDADQTTATMDSETLKMFAGLRMSAIVDRTRNALRRMGPRSIKELSVEHPIKGGLEEVVALVRIGKAIGCYADADIREDIYFTDSSGILMKATVPTMILDPDRFPESLLDFEP